MGVLRLFFFQAEDGIRDLTVTGVQTCALPISGAHEVEQQVEVKADGRQRARAPWRITAQQRNRDDEPKEEHAVAGRAVRSGVGILTPEDAKPVEIRHRPRQHDDEAIPRGDSRQVGDDPAEAHVRQEMRRRKHGGYLTTARSRFTSSSYESRLMIASNWAR